MDKPLSGIRRFIVMRTVSYRFDELTLSVFPPDYGKMDLFQYIEKCGYRVRDVTKRDEIRKAQGYDPKNAKMINIDAKWYTLQTREEWGKNNEDAVFLGHSGLIVLSSSDLDKVHLKRLLKDFENGCKATRFDIAMDIVYTDSNGEYGEYETKKLRKQQNEICKLVGFSENYESGNVQNPKNKILGGRRNSKHPISKCSKTVSNGLTLYIGSRSSKFMTRMYDKSAEVKNRIGEDIPPTLRFEIEAKQEQAQAVQRFIVKTDGKRDITAKRVWQGLADDNINFEVNETKRNTFAEQLKLEKAMEITLDYSRIENEKLEYEYWVQHQVAPSFRRKYGELSDEEQLKTLAYLFLGKKYIHISIDKPTQE